MTKPLKAVSIQAISSLDFLENACRHYEAQTLYTVLRPGLDLSRYPGLNVVDRIDVKTGGGWGQLGFTPSTSDAPAQVLFSSGTEGEPKPIILSQRNISDCVARLNAAMEPDETIREYIGVPVTYSFGLGRIRAVSAVGGQFYLPERFDPIEIRDMLERGEINAISAVPTLWRIVLGARDHIGEAGQAVRWIEIGSQYMSAKEKEDLKETFPNARIVQHYGLTEASRSTFLDISRSDPSQLESVGAIVPPVGIKIGDAGEICIRGDHVALGILNDAGGIDPLTDEGDWLHTKDKGDIRGGMLYFLGRLDDQMNLSGVNISVETLEQEIVALCGCAGLLAVSSRPDTLRGDAVIIALDERVAERAPLIEKAAEMALAKFGIRQSGGINVFSVARIPVTETGKIRRKEIRSLFLTRSGAEDTELDRDTNNVVDLPPTAAQIADAWRKVVGQTYIAPHNTFYDVGGDSLSAVQIGLVMETTFDRNAVRATLEGRTLEEVTQAQDAAQSTGTSKEMLEVDALPDRTAATWSINISRALMALAVLLTHWGPGLFQRLGIAQEADYLLGGVIRIGTEGFATIFGIGLGFFFLPRYLSDTASVRKRLHLSLILVLAGLTLMAAVRILRLGLQDEEIDGLAVAQAFYNILAYYALAFATAPIWLRYLSAGNSVIARALVVVVLAIPATWVLRTVLPTEQLDSLLEWPRLMAVAGYSYFQMSALVFAGIAAGYWYSRQMDRRQASKTFALAGACGMALSMIIGLDVLAPNPFATSASPFFKGLLGTVFYFFTVVFLVGAFEMLLKTWNRMQRPTRGVLQILIVIGGLALPIYAFHGIVIPLKDILQSLGLPDAVALVLPLGAFVAVMLYLGWRLRRMYFG